MKTAKIIKAFVERWRASSLDYIPIWSGRPTDHTVQPYAVISAKHVNHLRNSGNWSVADYTVVVRVYSGQGLGDAWSISHEIGNVFDYQQDELLVEDARTLMIMPDEEGSELSADDLVGEDVVICHNLWRVRLRESKA